jgi:hypothetical protein
VNKTIRLACLAICFIFVAGIASAQTNGKKPAAEPTVFFDSEDNYGEEPYPFDEPVPLPDNVLDALRATKEAQSMEDQLKNFNREDFAKLFTAIKIHLGGPKELDYVVFGAFPMSGADNTWYWIVRSNPTPAKVIFFTNSNRFLLSKTKNNGYPDIRSEWCSAAFCETRIYHYNGHRYILAHQYEKENKP